MKKNTILATTIPATTIGLDLSDRTLQFCELNASGEIVGEGQCKLDRTTLRRYLAAKSAGTRVALETGGHSAWVRELIEEMGHEAVVANARDLEAVTGRSHRTDHHDARQLARLARVDASLLNPVELRRTAEQADLFVIRARAVLVEARTMLINFARGLLGPLMGTRHTLIDCLLDHHKTRQIPSADLLFCDAITFPRLRAHSRTKNVIPYNLISPECLDQIAAAMPVQMKNTLDSSE
jgi:transposase